MAKPSTIKAKTVKPKKAPVLEIEAQKPEHVSAASWKKLSPKQRIAVYCRCVLGMTETEAARHAGFKQGSGLWTQASRLFKNVEVSHTIEEAFERKGITFDKAVEVIAQAMDAESPMVMQDVQKDDKGRVKAVKQKVVYIADHNARIKAVKVFGDWRGLRKINVVGDKDKPIPITLNDPVLAQAITGFRKKVVKR